MNNQGKNDEEQILIQKLILSSLSALLARLGSSFFKP